MSNREAVVVATPEDLRDTLADVVRTVMLESVPQAIRETNKAKWLHREEVKSRYGVTNRQLQYLRDNREVTYTQRGRKVWYLRESIEGYFEEGRVEAQE
jgi:hypothetical protein